jgi:hypothetical protein
VSAPVAGQRFWFLDTASLLSMAVDDAIATAVLDEIDDDTVVVIDVVVSELEHRATIADTAALAKAALRSRPPDWVELDTNSVPLELVLAAQEDVADGRVLNDESQHWAESTIIAMGRQSAASGSTSIKVLLSEDYDARRVAAAVANMEALSIHRLLHGRVHGDRMTADAAAEIAEKLNEAWPGTGSDGRRLRRPDRPPAGTHRSAVALRALLH